MGSSTRKKDSTQPKRLATATPSGGGMSGGSSTKDLAIPLVRIVRSVLAKATVGDPVLLVQAVDRISVNAGDSRLGDIAPSAEDLVRGSKRTRGTIHSINVDTPAASIVLR